jgi:hypothetical protein
MVRVRVTGSTNTKVLKKAVEEFVKGVVENESISTSGRCTGSTQTI